MPEIGRHPAAGAGPIYQGTKIGPNTQAMMNADTLSKRDTFKADLDKLEARMEQRLLYACAVSGVVGAIVGFMIFVLVGLLI